MTVRDKNRTQPVAAEPPKELLLPDIYEENNWTPKLALVDEPLLDGEDSVGFNPYDTAVLYKG